MLCGLNTENLHLNINLEDKLNRGKTNILHKYDKMDIFIIFL